jgi:hypothetical protein
MCLFMNAGSGASAYEEGFAKPCVCSCMNTGSASSRA